MRFMVKKPTSADTKIYIVDTEQELFCSIDYNEEDKRKALEFAERITKELNNVKL